MRKLFWTLCLITIATTGASASEDVAAVMKKTADRLATYSSWTADYVQSMDMMGNKMEMSGRIMSRGNKEMRMEVRMPAMMGGEMMTMVLGKDGIMWQDMKMGDQRRVMKIDTAQMSGMAGTKMGGNIADQMDPRKQIEEMQKNFDLGLAAGQELHGAKMYVLEGEAKEGGTSPHAHNMSKMFGKMRMYVGQEDGFVHKIEVYAKDGETLAMVQEFTNLAFNIDLPDEKFVFTPPEGVQVMDMTEMMKQMHRSGGPGKLPEGHPPIGQKPPAPPAN